jgi:vacuolar-type H+-ATPase subunit D/Vma8
MITDDVAKLVVVVALVEVVEVDSNEPPAVTPLEIGADEVDIKSALSVLVEISSAGVDVELEELFSVGVDVAVDVEISPVFSVVVTGVSDTSEVSEVSSAGVVGSGTETVSVAGEETSGTVASTTGVGSSSANAVEKKPQNIIAEIKKTNNFLRRVCACIYIPNYNSKMLVIYG